MLMRKRFCFLIVALFLAAPAYGQNAKLIEAAKKEGKVAAYESLE